MTLRVMFVVLVLLACMALWATAERAPVSVAANDHLPWSAIVAEQPAKLPAPRENVVWMEDLGAAREQARREGRPLFVTLRCLPCKQCLSFDQEVMAGGEVLDPLLAHFVTVRITDASTLNLRLFPVDGFQDFDLSWWGWLFSDKSELYGVFGGRDHVSDTSRVSVGALASTLKRVLTHHYHPKRPEWDLDGTAPVSGDLLPAALPGYRSWIKKTPPNERMAGCLRCHQVGEILRQPAIDAGTFDKVRDLAVWPLPENVGLEVERDHGLLVSKVVAGGAAANAGLKVGDILVAAGNRRLFGQTDLRGVLHRGPKGAGAITIRWQRGTEFMSGELRLVKGWRHTPLGWRASVSQGNVGPRPGFFPLSATVGQREHHSIPGETMAVRPYFGRHRGAAFRAGLREHDIIVAVNGESPDLSGREWLTWFRLNHEAGKRIVFTVVDHGKKRRIAFVATETD